ncbi:hypothetical protein CLIM01_12436 [Colletotrichum limetticola]|uniref:Uncharacterized protein n=1 Tax=Colletotrichum limetticola TaxID=1209924 RepID=A0ABQ9PDY7_9PEZI|nr:hypothetical protein CLIM01_12436 [Colletotrichum limetticola]
MWFNAGGSWGASLSSLFLLFTLILNVAAQTFGITLDKAARDDAQRFVYSAKLTFEQDTGTLFSDGQLYGRTVFSLGDASNSWPMNKSLCRGNRPTTST